MSDICKTPFFVRYPYRGAHSINAVNSRTCYDDKLNTLFMRFNKVASNTICTSVWSLRKKVPEGVSGKHFFQRADRITEKELEKLESKGFKFVFVRNPFSRLLSCYLSVVKGKQMTQAPKTSFHDFVRHVEGHLHQDAHWCPQTDLLTLPKDRFDFIGRFENLDADLRYVLKRLSGRNKAPTTMNLVAPSNADTKLHEYYDTTLVKIVRRLYAPVFEAFDYDPHIL